jgi:GMP synthase (glutamine-hydrolysing)
MHVVQHVPFEDAGSIALWAAQRHVGLSQTRLFDGESLPTGDWGDCLVIMGGPMSVGDEDDYPWLKGEKAFIVQAIKDGKRVLGICLGAQLVAESLGARVYPNHQKEIGWYTIQRRQASLASALNAFLPDEAMVFHWHGDTFDLPAGAQPLASSPACQNQGFIYHDRVVALQFHLEMTPSGIAALIEHCGNELEPATYVQSAEFMLAHSDYCLSANQIMADLLNALTQI